MRPSQKNPGIPGSGKHVLQAARSDRIFFGREDRENVSWGVLDMDLRGHSGGGEGAVLEGFGPFPGKGFEQRFAGAMEKNFYV